MAHLLASRIALLTLAVAAAALPAVLASLTLCTRADASDQDAAATYTGGKITVADVRAELARGVCPPRQLCTFPSFEAQREAAVRAIAQSRILLTKAAELKLTEKPEWAAAEKMIEEQALAEYVEQQEWEKIKPTEDEIHDFAAEHMTHLFGKDMERDPLPDLKTQLVWHMRGKKQAEAISKRTDEAIQAFSWKQPPADSDWSKIADSGEAVALGGFSLSAGEARAVGRLWGRPVNNASDLSYVQNFIPERIPLAEMARKDKALEAPGFDDARRTVRERWLADLARKMIKDEWFSSFAPNEAEVLGWYEKNWKGEEDALVTYDALLIPHSSDGDAGSNEALAEAGEALKKLQGGATMWQLARDNPRWRLMKGAKRTLPQEQQSVFARAARGRLAGELLDQPIEDFGGYCLVRIQQVRAKRKTPLEFVRGAVVDGMLWDYKTSVYTDFEGALMLKYNLVIDHKVLSAVGQPRGG